MVNISSDTSIDSSDNDISEEEYNKQETKREQIIAQHQQQTTSHKRNHNLPTPPATKGSKKNSESNSSMTSLYLTADEPQDRAKQLINNFLPGITIYKIGETPKPDPPGRCP